MYALILASFSFSSIANAKPGDHIKLGSTTILTPTVQAAGQWESNPYQEQGSDKDPLNPGWATWVRPGLGLSFSNESLKLDASGSWKAFRHVEGDLRPLDSYNNGELRGDIVLFPNARFVAGEFQEDFRSSSRASDADRPNGDQPDDVDTIGDANVHRLVNDALGQVVLNPEGDLRLRAGGHLGWDRFMLPDGTMNQKTSAGPNLDLEWRFFPKTALAAHFEADRFDWSETSDGTLWKATGGLEGRITETITVIATAGYGEIIYPDSAVTDVAGLNGLVLTGLVKYQPGEEHVLYAGAKRDFEDVYFTEGLAYVNYIFKYQGQFGQHLGVLSEVVYRPEHYLGDVAREDDFLRARLDLSWRLTAWADLGAGVVYSSRTNLDGSYPGVDYRNVTGLFGATFTY